MSPELEIVTKLNDFVNKLNEKDVVVEIRKQPSYLSCFLLDENENFDIILIYKNHNEALLDDTVADIKNKYLCDMSQDSDVSGNPLEDTLNKSDINLKDFTVDESMPIFDKDLHFPLKSGVALRILNYVNLNLTPNVPVWVLQDSEDRQKSVLLGSSKTGNRYARSWVTLQGLLEKQPKIEDMLAKHYSYSPLKNRVTTEIYSKFHLSGSFLIGGSISVHATWSKPTFEIPSVGASLSLELKTKVGEPDSYLRPLWQQLILLKKYFTIVCEWKKSSFLLGQRNNINLPNSVGIFELNKDDLPLSERIIDVLMSPHHWSSGYSNTSSSFEDTLKTIKKGETYGMDLMDRLWLLLSECSTYEKLITNMSLVYQQVKKCPVQPFISMQKKSKLAEAIKFLPTDNSANFHLLVEPLEILLEIGLEKLKNDYVALFTQSETVQEDLMNVPILPSFATLDNLTWIETVSSCLTWMSRIHSISELVSITLSGIKSGIVSPDVTVIVKRIFSHYLNPQESPVHSLDHLSENPDLRFVTPIAAVNHSRFDTGDKPYEKWLMKLTTSNENVCVSNCFLYTTRSLFPESIFSDNKSITLCLDSTSTSSPGRDSASNKFNYFGCQMTSFSNKIG